MVAKSLSFLVLLFLSVIALPAQAGNEERAKAEFKAGYEELQKKNFDAALEHYERSYAQAPRPRTLFNIGLCYEGMGDFKEAISQFEKFLVEAEERDAAFLKEAREKLTRLKANRGAEVYVRSRPTGASVIVDDSVRGHTPIRVQLERGEHIIKVRKRGSRTSSRRIVVRPGEGRSELFQLDSVGHLQIEATPDDALIRRKDVDDVRTGSYDADLSPGSYEFEVSLGGYRTRKLTLKISANDRLNKSVRLEALSDTAELALRSDQLGARVSIDGLIVGSTRDRDGSGPRLERRLMAGHHVLFVEYENGSLWKKRFHVSPGETLTVDLRYEVAGARQAARWTLKGGGTLAMIAGGTLGVLAVSQIRSDSTSQNEQGRERAKAAGLLFGIGLGSLIGASYIRTGSIAAELDRSHN